VLIGLVAAASGVAQCFGRFAYGLLLPSINADLLHSYAVAGLLGSLNLTAYLLGTLSTSLLARAVAPAALLRRGLVGSTLGITTMAVAPNAPVFAAGTMLAGFSGAFIWVPAPVVASALMPAHRRGLGTGLSGAGIGFGILAASGLAALDHRWHGPDSWRPVWAVLAVVAAVVALLAALLLHPPDARPAEVAAGEATDAPVDDPPVRLSALREAPGWLGAMLSYGTYGIAVALYLNYVVAALTDDGGFSAGHAALVFGAVGVGQAVGGILMGRLSDRIGRRPVLMLGYSLMVAASGALLLHAEPWAVLSALAFGTAAAGQPSVLAAHLGDHLRPKAFASAFGALTLFFGLAQLGAPQLGGVLREAAGSFTTVFLLAGGVALLGVAAAASMPRRRPAVN
jgi:MFS family permease